VQQLLNVEVKSQRKKSREMVGIRCVLGKDQKVAERHVIAIAQPLRVKSVVHLRKRNKPLITLLSGPHVHKKSREQYKIENRSVIIWFVVPEAQS
jgi:hypothetical protein